MYNQSQASSASAQNLISKKLEAQAEALMPLWPLPQNGNDFRLLPPVSALGISPSTWKNILDETFSEKNSSGQKRQLTLTNPECALSPDAWRVSAARLSLYEVDLPGNIATWNTLALHRESDFAQRVQVHVTVQPWCTSERLGRSDFVHTLDHAFLLSFDLTLPHVSQQKTQWMTELSSKLLTLKNEITLRASTTLLPFATATIAVHDGPSGRKSILKEWNSALETQSLIESKQLPSSTWSAFRQSIMSGNSFSSANTTPQSLAHPKLKANPNSLNSFFNRFLSEKNLLRVRAHITEGLGTSQRFLRWDNIAGRLRRSTLQTLGAHWNRSTDTMTFVPLLNENSEFAQIGQEQSASESARTLLKDVDLEATLLASDVSLQQLLSLREKVIDSERASVNSTRCVSCHGLDDALRMARAGRPASQRGLSPISLSVFGLNADAQTVVNLRTLRAAEADAARFEEETQNDTPRRPNE